MNFVIVESPAKAKTIARFLGDDYVVKSSIGHIRDIPKEGMGIDIENNFEPRYEISRDKKKLVADLKKTLKKASQVYLATDEDREGEAIAWHLIAALELPQNTPRIVFHEITKNAINNALKNPRVIDKSLVGAQQARRVLDRLVGFEISPILWRKISGAKSAGRVQSPVVRLVVEREREIQNFKPKSNYPVKAILTTIDGQSMDVKLNRHFSNQDEAMAFINSILNAKLTVSDITLTPTKRTPPPPFMTSTLQQEAAQKLGFSVKQTMTIAQDLYRQGYISYMRTDSLNLSEFALNQAKELISKKYGKSFVCVKRYHTKSRGAQEAHEAIRPTDLTKPKIDGIEERTHKLYQLIYKRTLASQISPAKLKKTRVHINIAGKDEFFNAEGEVLDFAGFLVLYDTKNNTDKLLPNLTTGDLLSLKALQAKESFSRPKARYTEATLVKTIEEMGIGRPSTFATMISTVQERSYVTKETRPGKPQSRQIIEVKDGVVHSRVVFEVAGAEKNKLFPTSVAYLLTDFLSKYFDNIVDYRFSANLELDFDKIATKQKTWQEVIKEFYKPFHKQISSAKALSREETHHSKMLGIDPKTGRPVSVRLGRYGAFVQLGDKNDAEKPVFSSLKAEQSIETITLAEALELFKMPRIIGKTKDNKIVKANYGRYGPYIQYGTTYVSLGKHNPEKVTLETALALIADKESQDAKRIIKTFTDSDIQVLKGRFGPYISNGKKKGKGQKNITIKKVLGDVNPADLTLADCELALKKSVSVRKRQKAKINKNKDNKNAKSPKAKNLKHDNGASKSTIYGH